MEYQEILYDTSDGVATITINRPDTLNALTSLTQAEIRHALFISDTTEEVVGTVITGSGRGFCLTVLSLCKNSPKDEQEQVHHSQSQCHLKAYLPQQLFQHYHCFDYF